MSVPCICSLSKTTLLGEMKMTKNFKRVFSGGPRGRFMASKNSRGIFFKNAACMPMHAQLIHFCIDVTEGLTSCRGILLQQ